MALLKRQAKSTLQPLQLSMELTLHTSSYSKDRIIYVRYTVMWRMVSEL
jgi:hypothetical protein